MNQRPPTVRRQAEDRPRTVLGQSADSLASWISVTETKLKQGFLSQKLENRLFEGYPKGMGWVRVPLRGGLTRGLRVCLSIAQALLEHFTAFGKLFRRFYGAESKGRVTTGRIYPLQLITLGWERAHVISSEPLIPRAERSPHTTAWGFGGRPARQRGLSTPDGSRWFWPGTAFSKRKSLSRRARSRGTQKLIIQKLCQGRKSEPMFTISDYTHRSSNNRI